MKGLMAVLSIIAVANIIAVAGVLGWLNSSDRLSKERVQKVREVFTKTNAEEAAEKAAEEAKKKAEDVKAAEEAKKQRPPLTAEQQLGMKADLNETERQKMKRLEREVADLSESLAEAKRLYSSTRDQLEKERKDALAALESGAASPQFKKAVGVLDGLKAPECRSLLGQLLEGNGLVVAGMAPIPTEGPAAPGKAPSEPAIRQVVAYLNAMQERNRIKVIGEFQKDDPKLAALLLERLRAFGTVVGGAPGSPKPGTARPTTSAAAQEPSK
jgi:hypothetical protein